MSTHKRRPVSVIFMKAPATGRRFLPFGGRIKFINRIEASSEWMEKCEGEALGLRASPADDYRFRLLNFPNPA
ncbi:hypothetical protein LCM4579_04355 [Ensifer sp. LCM 4579]|nr:hypothetical protein LCM4579_04355 [Ensifer sp. LCM 4579]